MVKSLYTGLFRKTSLPTCRIIKSDKIVLKIPLKYKNLYEGVRKSRTVLSCKIVYLVWISHTVSCLNLIKYTLGSLRRVTDAKEFSHRTTKLSNPPLWIHLKTIYIWFRNIFKNMLIRNLLISYMKWHFENDHML